MSIETFLSVIVTSRVALYSPLRRTETRQVSALPSGQRRDLPREEWFGGSPDSRLKKPVTWTGSSQLSIEALGRHVHSVAKVPGILQFDLKARPHRSPKTNA